MTPVFGHGHLRLYLLNLLDESPKHGYELIQALSERFGGWGVPVAGAQPDGRDARRLPGTKQR